MVSTLVKIYQTDDVYEKFAAQLAPQLSQQMRAQIEDAITAHLYAIEDDLIEKISQRTIDKMYLQGVVDTIAMTSNKEVDYDTVSEVVSG